MAVLSKNDLVAQVAQNIELDKKTTDKVITAALDAIITSLKAGHDVRFIGFGSFSKQRSEAREGRNPRTGETIKIAASNKPVFKAGKEFKDAVN